MVNTKVPYTEAARVRLIEAAIQVELKLRAEGTSCTATDKWALISRTLSNDEQLHKRSEHAIAVMFAELLRHHKAKSYDLRLTDPVVSKLKDYEDLMLKLDAGPSSSDIELMGTTVIDHEDRQQADKSIRTRVEPTTISSPVSRGEAFASRDLDENDQNLRDIQWLDRGNLDVLLNILSEEKVRCKEVVDQHFRSVPEGRTVIDKLREAWSSSTLGSGSGESSCKNTSKKLSLSGYKTSESKAEKLMRNLTRNLIISMVQESYRKRHAMIAEVMKKNDDELWESVTFLANLLLTSEDE